MGEMTVVQWLVDVANSKIEAVKKKLGECGKKKELVDMKRRKVTDNIVASVLTINKWHGVYPEYVIIGNFLVVLITWGWLLLVSPQLACYIMKLVSNWWWFIVYNYYLCYSCIIFSINLVHLCFLYLYTLTMLTAHRSTFTKLLHAYVLYYFILKAFLIACHYKSYIMSTL